MFWEEGLLLLRKGVEASPDSSNAGDGGQPPNGNI